MIKSWRKNVDYEAGDIIERRSVSFLPRKPSRFNKRKSQKITRKELYKAVL